MKLVVGLGNPGRKYQQTRHNSGFLVVDRIALREGVRLKNKRRGALCGDWPHDEETVILAKPQSFMNRSGAVVRALLEEFHAGREDLIVVYDDIDLPFGRIRVRPRGSAGGHRGVLSVDESLGGAPFLRVRVGVGRPPEGMEAADYVLQRFDDPELAELGAVLEKASAAVISLIDQGAEKTMEQFNRAS